MCLAIVKPAGIAVPENYLRNGYAENSDGAGIAYALDGKLHVLKSFSLERFLEYCAAVEHLPCLIHFRFATHGPTDEANCHPWLFKNGELAAIHNGIINIATTTKGEESMSDTGIFVNLVLDPMSRRVPVSHPAFRYLVEQSIGKSNKIAVMDVDGSTTIFNEGSGEWSKGVWYSNPGYKREPMRWVNESDLDNDWDQEYRKLSDHYERNGVDRSMAEELAFAELEEQHTERYGASL